MVDKTAADRLWRRDGVGGARLPIYRAKNGVLKSRLFRFQWAGPAHKTPQSYDTRTELERVTKEVECYRTSVGRRELEMKDLNMTMDERVTLNVKLQERLEYVAKEAEEHSLQQATEAQVLCPQVAFMGFGYLCSAALCLDLLC